MNKFPELSTSTQKLILRTNSSNNTQQVNLLRPDSSQDLANAHSQPRANRILPINAQFYQKKDPRLTQVQYLNKKNFISFTDTQQIAKLQIQVQNMQKQIKLQQSSQSFIRKITNDQCTFCEKLKIQLEESFEKIKHQEKIIKDQLKEIENLKFSSKSSQNKFQISQIQLSECKKLKQTVNDNSIRLVERQLFENINKILYCTLYFKNENNLEMIQFCLVSDHEKQIQLENSQRDKQDQIITEQSKKISDIEKLLSQNNKQMANVLKNSSLESLMNDQLKAELQELEISLKNQKELSDQLSQNLATAEERLKKQADGGKSVLPNNIHLLKRTIDLNIVSIEADKQMKLETQVKLLERDKSALQSQIKDQDIKIMSSAKGKNIESHLIKIEALEMELYLSLRCTKCRELLRDPVTCIPCGHTYCLKCHKGQKLSCEKCDATGNTDALYRNIQFDELIKIYSIIQGTKQFIKNCLLQI